MTDTGVRRSATYSYPFRNQNLRQFFTLDNVDLDIRSGEFLTVA